MTSVKGLYSAWDKVCQYMDKYGESILGANEEATRYTIVGIHICKAMQVKWLIKTLRNNVPF